MMDDPNHVFQCDYCGRKAPLSAAVLAWAQEDWLSVGDEIMFTVSVTCSPSCAEKVNDIRIAR
jgi:hypothetical protein